MRPNKLGGLIISMDSSDSFHIYGIEDLPHKQANSYYVKALRFEKPTTDYNLVLRSPHPAAHRQHHGSTTTGIVG